MRIKLLVDKDLNGNGKVIPRGSVIDVLGDLGMQLIRSGEGKDDDAPKVGLKIKEPKKKIGKQKIETRK